MCGDDRWVQRCAVRNVKHSAVRFKTPARTASAALLGLIAAQICFLVFVLHMVGTSTRDFGALMVDFLVYGVGAGVGLLLLRRLVPRPAPETLFAGSVGVFVQPTTRSKIPAQTAECSPDGAKIASGMPVGKEVDLVRSHHRHQSISRYKAPQGGGAISLVSMAGISIVLMGCPLHFVRQFLGLAVIAGGAIALVLYWGRCRRQNSSIFRYTTSVGGGVIGLISMIGISIVLMGCRFLIVRQFLGLAITAGGLVALVLYWSGRRRQNSSNSII